MYHVPSAYYPSMNSPPARLSVALLALLEHKKAQEELKELQIIIDRLDVKNNPVHELRFGKLCPQFHMLEVKAGNAQEELHRSMDRIEFYSAEDADKKIAKMKQMIRILDTEVLPELQAQLALSSAHASSDNMDLADFNDSRNSPGLEFLDFKVRIDDNVEMALDAVDSFESIAIPNSLLFQSEHTQTDTSLDINDDLPTKICQCLLLLKYRRSQVETLQEENDAMEALNLELAIHLQQLEAASDSRRKMLTAARAHMMTLEHHSHERQTKEVLTVTSTVVHRTIDQEVVPLLDKLKKEVEKQVVKITLEHESYQTRCKGIAEERQVIQSIELPSVPMEIDFDFEDYVAQTDSEFFLGGSSSSPWS
ncbi:hypothetical protein BDP27DRAFT_1464643 [Rhodocollybia butyracea]|uniref:Uncharacterized protein n=1 Tax=Rhodocollybia butyracea TaxID=206335 RepID=A0A9P5PGV4_9AGAR|nr:hypothetical protein BDP27DRAFT_1464643 [Rhodocollybia butyracea]